MTEINVKNKEIDVSKLVIVEDSHDFEEFIFTIDEDLSDLNVFIQYRNADGMCYIDLLTERDGKYVWKPTHRATAVNGMCSVQIVGMEFSAEGVVKRWSSLASDIAIQNNIEAEELIDEPSQSLIEDEICGELE